MNPITALPSRQYGVGTAINIGDYLIGLGYRLVSRERRALGAECAGDILDRLADAHQKLAEGQVPSCSGGMPLTIADEATPHRASRAALLLDRHRAGTRAGRRRSWYSSASEQICWRSLHALPGRLKSAKGLAIKRHVGSQKDEVVNFLSGFIRA
jgi:hypothetical protein